MVPSRIAMPDQSPAFGVRRRINLLPMQPLFVGFFGVSRPRDLTVSRERRVAAVLQDRLAPVNVLHALSTTIDVFLNDLDANRS